MKRCRSWIDRQARFPKNHEHAGHLIWAQNEGKIVGRMMERAFCVLDRGHSDQHRAREWAEVAGSSRRSRCGGGG